MTDNLEGKLMVNSLTIVPLRKPYNRDLNFVSRLTEKSNRVSEALFGLFN